MGGISPGRGGGGGGRASLKLRVPPDIFTGANRTAAVTARNNGLNAAALAEFDADPNLAIILRIGGADTYQVRRGGQWRDVTNVVRGPTGAASTVPGPPGLGFTPENLQKLAGIEDNATRDLSAAEIKNLLDNILPVGWETTLGGQALLDAVDDAVRGNY